MKVVFKKNVFCPEILEQEETKIRDASEESFAERNPSQLDNELSWGRGSDNAHSIYFIKEKDIYSLFKSR